MAKHTDPNIKDVLDKLSKAYADSPATTKAGLLVRLFVKFVPLGILLDALVHKHK